ncbi:MAG: hypothetical protein IJY84_06525 [Clostridia bacterium]|nr:hypothetical protein [Clostridia bacterium]
MQSKIKWIFSLLLIGTTAFALSSCMPKVDSESKGESAFYETTYESQAESAFSSGGEETDESNFSGQESFESQESASQSENENSSQSERVEESDSESASESQTESLFESEIDSESAPETEGESEIESESESSQNQIIVTVSGWTVDLGDFATVLTYEEPVIASQIVKDSGVTVSAGKLSLSTYSGGKLIKINSNTQINSSCEIVVDDARTYVAVCGVDENGAQKTVYLLLGIKTYRAGNAIADAGFSFDDLYWEITRTGSGVATTEPLTSSQLALKDKDVLTGKILGAVRVYFDCADYGELAFGGYELDYAKNSIWNNPKINLPKSLETALHFEGWALNKRAIGNLFDVKWVNSVEQIFAQKLEKVTLYPVFSINYDNLQGWFKIEEQNAYAQIVGEEVFFHGASIDTNGAVSLSVKGGEVYLKLDASLSSDEKREFRLDFDKRPTGAIMKIRVDDQNGSNIIVCEGREQFDALLAKGDLVLRWLYCNGVSVTEKQIEKGKYYTAYFAYYTYP